eukprot:a174973_75.p1 GENE.a174973_75~~a174973_75.p1  ORF type:complete len:406 (-),score=179.55 a174973_75:1156-2328(-)
MGLVDTIKFVFRFAIQNPLLVVKALVSAFWRASLPRKIIIAGVLYALYKFFYGRKPRVLTMNRKSLAGDSYGKTAVEYEKLYDKQDATERLSSYTTVVNHYYDLATDFYRTWGDSFHFAVRHANETLAESVARHEHFLAARLGLREGMKVLDVGCGIGGPLVSISRFSGASVTGLNNNAYQITQGEELLGAAGLKDRCGFIKADFMHIPVEDNTFDAVYEIEATCHAPDRVACYREIARVLKPGALFGGYEWTMTEKFDPSNAQHQAIKHEIAIGNGLPDVITTPEVRAALVEAGFEIVEFADLAPTTEINPIPWYADFEGGLSLKGFPMTPIGRTLTHTMVRVLETLRLAPAGSTRTHGVLLRAANGLLIGGQQRLFTPMLFFVARKRS